MTELPTTFGKYYLTELLAIGGMAEIYLAKIIGPGGFEKALVIKQIHPKLSGQRHFVDLFVAEAKTLVTLAHGNIVPVYELGVVDDTYFIAMDYIDGPTLYRLTETMTQKGAKMEPAVAAWITARILEGLDYAHRKGEGVIHRDLSPRNVMMSRDGEVKLVDFGIAVTLGEPGEAEAAQSAPTGSFPYMSPEQVRREPLSGQTDLFSVGVLAWEMVVGERLFARADADATLEAVLQHDIPRPSAMREGVADKLDEVVMRALERDQGTRWPDAAEMLAALNKYLYSLDQTPGPRDVAALVAKYCPPETRRQPTHADAAGDTEPAAELETPVAGPRTAVVPRDGAAKGKKPQRAKTFATHVELEHMLERGTPLYGVKAIAEAPDGETERASAPTADATAAAKDDPTPVPAPRASSKLRARSEKPDVIAPDQESDEPAPAPSPQPQPRQPIAPARALMVLGGLGVIAMGIATVVVFFNGRDRVLASMIDARPADARMMDAPAAPRALDAPAAAIAPLIDAGTTAAVRPDAGHSIVQATLPDARVHSDAALAPDAPKPAGDATLVIGANPWGEIFVDDVKKGETPQTIIVPSGHHVVRIDFAPQDLPARHHTDAIDVAPGETRHLQADFN